MTEQDNTPPSPLPETLPVGTLYRTAVSPECLFRFREEAKRGFSSWGAPVYFGKIARIDPGEDLAQDGMAQVGMVDWAHWRTLIAAQDRPIQAGDWVECVDAGRFQSIENGQRYRVERVHMFGMSGDLYLEGRLSNYGAFRFKRVDGPHPEAHGRCDECGNLPENHHSLTCSCSTHVVDPVTPQPDPYVTRRLARIARGYVERPAATARLEAGLRSERVRPVASARARRELALPHPWSCEDVD